MSQTELIQNLNQIAYEGWEYHKLPLESFDTGWAVQQDWSKKSLSLPFQNQSGKKSNNWGENSSARNASSK